MIFDRRQLKAIAALSLPAVVTNITTPLLSLTDVAIVGHFGSAVYIAAIAVGGTMFNMLFWLMGFLRMGSSGMTAQAFGSGDIRMAHIIFNRALAMAGVIGLAFVALQQPLCDILVDILDVDRPTQAVARTYFGICIWGAPAVLGMFALTGWCIGMQNSRIPMWVSIFIDLFNIFLSLTLVFGFGMRIEGVAIGTLAAQWCGFLFGLIVCIRKYGWYWARIRELAQGLGKFFRINVDIFLRTLCLVAVTMWFTRVGAEQGALMLAVNALLMQLFTLFSYMMDGLAFAAEALCGRYLGAGDGVMLRRTIRSVMGVGGVIALTFTILYVFGGDWIISLLSSDESVLSMTREYSVWAICVPLVSFSAFVWDGVFIGMTHTRAMLLSVAAGMVAYFVIYFALSPMDRNHGLWIAFLVYLFVRGVVLTIAARRFTHKPTVS